MTVDLQGQVCLVTGANSGIGKAAAIGLATMGATVVLVCRSRARGAAAQEDIAASSGNGSLHLCVADLSSQAAVRDLADEIRDRFPRLHVLVNNAGVFRRSRHLTENGLEETFAINHLGYFLLTDLLLDLLKAGAPSRIVSVSSDAHSGGTIDFADLQSEQKYSAMGAYGQSKLANVLFTYELARRLDGTGVTATCLHPGLVATNFFRDIPRALRLVMAPIRPFMLSAEKGADTVLYLAAAPEVAGVTGEYFVKRKSVRSSKASYDTELARRLWDVSADLAGLSDAGNSHAPQP